MNLKVSGGERAKRYLAALQQAVGGATGVRVGFLEKSTYPAQRGRSQLHIAQVAFWNEFGTSTAPARPFFRQMIGEELGDWGDTLGAHLKASRFDTGKAFGLLGVEVKDALTNKIASWPADNAPATVARKGFDHGLVEKGLMQRATGLEVLTGA